MPPVLGTLPADIIQRETVDTRQHSKERGVGSFQKKLLLYSQGRGGKSESLAHCFNNFGRLFQFVAQFRKVTYSNMILPAYIL
jgi:hypothetical protein